MNRDRLQFPVLYLTRFAGGFGFVTLVTLLPTYIDLLDPSSGLVLGAFTAGFTAAQALAVVPVAWAADRYDKRAVLLFGLAASVLAYAAFALVQTSAAFIVVRAVQGVAVTSAGLVGLAMVGELADRGARANRIGRANAARLGAGVLGTLSAGALYQFGGFDAVFGVIVALMVVTLAAVLLLVEPDDTTVYGFPFSDLAVNRRILTLTGFRAPYALAVTLVRTWVPIYAGVEAAKGGLAYAPLAVAVVITAEKLTNMLCQPRAGRLSDRHGRALFVLAGGGAYGLIAFAVPFAPAVGELLGLPAAFPALGPLSAAFLPLVALNALLGVADSFREPASMALFADEGTADGGVASSFGIRDLVWRPGSILAPLLGGVLMTDVDMASVFHVGGLAALVGVAAFAGLLGRFHGRAALAEW